LSLLTICRLYLLKPSRLPNRIREFMVVSRHLSPFQLMLMQLLITTHRFVCSTRSLKSLWHLCQTLYSEVLNHNVWSFWQRNYWDNKESRIFGTLSLWPKFILKGLFSSCTLRVQDLNSIPAQDKTSSYQVR